MSGIYLVASGFATDANFSPDSVIIFSQGTTGYLDDEVGNWEIAGSQISVDKGGNIYTLVDNEIEVIPPVAPLLLTSRALPVGSGAKISNVVDMTASAIGEIFVSDGKGIAVFNPTATGNVDPDRYILGTAVTPGQIAVDSSDNLYVQNLADSSIAIFGPTDNGTVVPAATISGPLTHLTGPGTHSIQGLATDSSGKLYVLCACARADGGTDFGVFEFAPLATGNVAPIGYVTDARMNPNVGKDGIAVDSGGTIYVSAANTAGIGTVFEFSSSDTVTASNVVTVLYSNALAGIAVH